MSIGFEFIVYLIFYRGEDITKKGEPIDYFGIIVHGRAYICHDYKNMKTLEVGDMIGYMNAADFTHRENHLFTINAKTDGIIAILAFSELKAESRKSPKEVSLFSMTLQF